MKELLRLIAQLTKSTKTEAKNILRDIKSFPTKTKVEERMVKAVNANSELMRNEKGRVATMSVDDAAAKGLGWKLNPKTGKFEKIRGEVVSTVQGQVKRGPGGIRKRQSLAVSKGKDSLKVRKTGTFRRSLNLKQWNSIKDKVKDTKIRRKIRQVAAGTLPFVVLAPPIKKLIDKLLTEDSSRVASVEAADIKDNKYKIKAGDTISEIARDKDTTVKKIKETNPNIKDLNKIKPGQIIKIPLPKVKDRKSVYQGMTKTEMAKIAKNKKGGGIIYKYSGGNTNKVVKRAAGGGVALRGHGAVRRI